MLRKTIARALALFLIVPYFALVANAQTYCEITGAAKGFDGVTIQPGAVLTVFKVKSRSGSIILSNKKPYTLKVDGTWTPALRLERNSVAYIYLNAPGFDEDKNNGSPFDVPDAPTAVLGTLQRAINFPAEIPVAIPPGNISVSTSTKAGLNNSDPLGSINYVTDDVRGAWQKGANGYYSLTGERVNLKEFGARGDAKIVDDASVSGSTVTSASAGFTSAINGMKFDAAGAGVAAELSAVIVSVTDSTHAELSIAASYTGSSKTVSLDAATIATGSINAGSKTLATGSAFFTADDPGKLIHVADVGARNISGSLTFVNSTTATMSVSASVAVSGRRLIFGSDDHAAIVNAKAALPKGGDIYFPPGLYINGSAVSVSTSNLTFSGAGKNASVVYAVGPMHSNSGSMFNSFKIEDNTSNVHFEGLGFSGTNWTAQSPAFVADCDGVYISTSGISNISAINCRFDSFWSIGFHNPGSVGATASAPTAVINITLTNSDAALNAYDGLNPCPRSGLTVQGGHLHHNGTAGIEAATSNANIETTSYYNFQGGASVGGYGDPEIGTNNKVSGTYTLNGAYGVALGSNMKGCLISKAACSKNGYAGVELVSDGGATLGGYNEVNNCPIFSNGSFGIILSDSYDFITNCKIFDAGLTGYSQSIGIVVNGTGNKIWFNDNIGHPSQDYNFAISGTTNSLIKSDPTATEFITSGAIVTRATFDRASITGTLKLQGANGTASYSEDVSDHPQTILNNATWQPFGAVAEFSGELLINDTSITGSLARIGCGGGGCTLGYTTAAGNWSTTANTASSINVYEVSGIVTIQNKMGSTLIVTVHSVKTRGAP